MTNLLTLLIFVILPYHIDVFFCLKNTKKKVFTTIKLCIYFLIYSNILVYLFFLNIFYYENLNFYQKILENMWFFAFLAQFFIHHIILEFLVYFKISISYLKLFTKLWYYKYLLIFWIVITSLMISDFLKSHWI